jgi:hypothetical protein
MNKMINKNIYEGSNPVFESILKQSGLYEQEKKTLDPVLNIISALNTLFTMILDSKMENYKSPQEFESSLGNKIISANDLMSFKSAIMPVVKTLAVSDPENKQYAEQNVKFIEANLSPLDKILKSAEEFQKVKEKIKEVVDGFKVDLQNRANDLKKTKETAVKESSITEQQGKTGDETNVQYGQFEGPSFDRSKEAIDAALAFTGEVTRDKYNKAIASDAQIQKFEGIANDLLKQARDLQLVDRKGLKIVTAEGTTHKRNDYKLKIDSLINEIIRQKKEYRRVRDLVLSNAQTSYVPAPVPVVVKPTVEPVKDETQPKKEDSKASCTFPVKIGSAKCDEVVKLQTKIMDLFPDIAKFLESRGKADGRYGKGTSKCVNIILGYLNRTKEISLVGDLTKDGYDSIMALEEKDILRKGGAVVKESINLEEYYKNRIFEAEYNEGVPVLRFESFAKTITSNYPPVNEDDDKNLGFKIPEECLNKSIDSGEIDLDCLSKSPKEEDKKKEEEKKKWVGLKPVKDNIYVISYDESALSVVGKATIGTIAGVAVVLTGGAALGLYAPAALGGAAAVGSAAAGTALPGTLLATGAGMTALGSLVGGAAIAAVPTVIGAGAVGGAAASQLMGGRTNIAITVTSGFISRGAIIRMVRGLINTLDGRVSDDDIQAIMSTLAVLKGAWTCNVEETQAISAWGEVKRLYTKKEKEDLISEIKSIGTLTVSNVENFPEFNSKTLAEGDDTDAEDAMDQIKEAIDKLNANETALSKNLSGITQEMIEASIEGSAMVKRDEIKSEENEEGQEAEEAKL